MSEQTFTPTKRAIFLATLRETCNVTLAARAAGISRKRAYDIYNEEPDFKELWDNALQEGIDVLEAEAQRRAFGGIDKPLTHQGQFTYLRDFDAIDPETGQHYPPHLAPVKKDPEGRPMVATVKEYSDTLTIFLLKAHRPERFRDNSKLELTGANGGPVELTDSDAAARLAKLMAAAEARRKAEQDDGK